MVTPSSFSHLAKAPSPFSLIGNGHSVAPLSKADKASRAAPAAPKQAHPVLGADMQVVGVGHDVMKKVTMRFGYPLWLAGGTGCVDDVREGIR